MANLLEELVMELNGSIFYREFSFAKNQFIPRPGESKELADHVVWIDDLLIVYQLKERGCVASGSVAERNWFENKVITKATKQIKDTLRYLKDYPQISIENQRGHRFELNADSDTNILKLILYRATEHLPVECRQTRHYLSSTAGFIHILPWSDYLGVCGTLITPAELAEYFAFRQSVIEGYRTGPLPSEPALLGQFISGIMNEPPSEWFTDYLARLKRDRQAFDLGLLLRNLGEKIEASEGPLGDQGYYPILAEFAKLNRNELKQVKHRVDLCLESAAKGQSFPPTRFYSPATGCGFLFFTADHDILGSRLNLLQNFTYASKCELRCDRHIGVVFAEEGEHRLIDWCLLESKWQSDPLIEEMLKKNYPFLPLRTAHIGRYDFE